MDITRIINGQESDAGLNICVCHKRLCLPPLYSYQPVLIHIDIASDSKYRKKKIKILS